MNAKMNLESLFQKHNDLFAWVGGWVIASAFVYVRARVCACRRWYFV
jgi:hypothetical protein